MHLISKLLRSGIDTRHREGGCLQGLRIHALRETAATRLLQAGVDHNKITAMLGHEDLRTTLQHNAQATPESLRAASRRLVDAVQSGDVITNFAPRSVEG